MKKKLSTTSTARKIISTSGVTALLDIPSDPVTEAIHTAEHPGARGTHGSPGRGEIRKTIHRVMGSRQSQRTLERHDQPRQKRQHRA